MSSEWGRIDADGTVYVTDGRRRAGDRFLAGRRRRSRPGVLRAPLRGPRDRGDAARAAPRLGAGDPVVHPHTGASHSRSNCRPRPRSATWPASTSGWTRCSPPRRAEGRRRLPRPASRRGPKPSRPRRRSSSRPNRSPSPARRGRPPVTACARSSTNGSRSRASTARPTRRCGSGSRPPATRSASAAGQHFAAAGRRARLGQDRSRRSWSSGPRSCRSPVGLEADRRSDART